ncbi:MAG TPA: hypothetical protein VL096_08290, partial [Pirellulaceae bacterium]|nr:hypothetical protein [Pirellulaceae bacterium]
LGGAGVLTVLAMVDDNYQVVAERLKLVPEPSEDPAAPPVEIDPEIVKKINNAKDFHVAKVAAEHEAARMVELVNRRVAKEDGTLTDRLLIPKQGAVYLLRNDPLTQGPKLFARHCASCHDYVDPAGKDTRWAFANQLQTAKLADGKSAVLRDDKGQVVYDETANGAPNLYGFASRAWIRGVLNPDSFSEVKYGEPIKSTDREIAKQANHPDNFRRPIQAPYFGNTAHREGRMATWLKQHVKEIDAKDLDAIVIALSAQAQLRSQAEVDQKDSMEIAHGVSLIKSTCATGCHRFGDAGQLGVAPDLTGYGSYEWLLGMVSDPTHDRFYRSENDRMPSFAKDLDHPEKNNVSVRELSLIVDWLRGDYYEASDKLPVLPHHEEFARRTVERARTIEAPALTLAGSATLAQPLASVRAAALFRQNCAACHNHVDAQGRGIMAWKPSAPNLFGFGSRAWLTGLLDAQHVDSPDYFGGTAHREGDMVTFVKDELGKLDDAKKKELTQLVIALSAEGALPKQKTEDAAALADGSIEKGKAALVDTFECTNCHKFYDAGEETAPDLTGYGSLAWLKGFIGNPGDAKFYGTSNDRMP